MSFEDNQRMSSETDNDFSVCFELVFGFVSTRKVFDLSFFCARNENSLELDNELSCKSVEDYNG